MCNRWTNWNVDGLLPANARICQCELFKTDIREDIFCELFHLISGFCWSRVKRAPGNGWAYSALRSASHKVVSEATMQWCRNIYSNSVSRRTALFMLYLHLHHAHCGIASRVKPSFYSELVTTTWSPLHVSDLNAALQCICIHWLLNFALRTIISLSSLSFVISLF